MLPLWVAAFSLLATGAAAPLSGQAQDPAVADDLEVLEEAPVEQYRAYRRMHAQNEKFNQEAWLEAWTEFDGRSFRYEIVSERGSEYVLNKVLKKVLASEQALIAGGHADRAELSADNYEFTEPASQGKGVRYVLLKPKRKDMLLVDGRMVLNQSGTELLRVEGRLAKNPSFWTSLVNIIREFARVDGVRVPVTTESIAKVKMAGVSRMTVRYEYESINGRPVSLSARRSMASAAPSR
jgi:hypothetical protein